MLKFIRDLIKKYDEDAGTHWVNKEREAADRLYDHKSLLEDVLRELEDL